MAKQLPDRFSLDAAVKVTSSPYADQGDSHQGPVEKVDEGAVGDYKARHLIRWFNEGADGKIPWGSPGDFDACVRVASEHMPIGKAKGFCANRHHDALGIWPATHAKEERGGKVKKQDVVKEFDPTETRDDHGRWSVMGAVEHAVDSVADDRGGQKRPKVSDRLKIASRIQLDHGEHLVGSSKVSGDAGTARLAATSRNGHTSVRIGIGNAAFGSRDSEGGPWTAGPDNTAALNAESAKARDEEERLGKRWDELNAAKPLNESDQAELKSIEDRLGKLEDTTKGDVYPDGYTANVSESGVERLRSVLSDALDQGAKVAANDAAKWDEIERLKSQQNRFRGMGRKWTDAEEAEWDALAAKIDALEAEAKGDDKGYRIFAEGSIPGEWADIHYRVELDDLDIGVEAILGAVPHGSGRDLDDLRGDEEAAILSPAETRQLLRQLGALVAPQPTGQGD